jgi:TolB-like protein/TPR repeat protein
MSPDPNDEYFAEGMTEEIISTVSGISGLRVISRTSVMGYKGTTKKVKEIGKELEVGSVLEGSFRKAGNRIRVTTQLINVADDEHLWAQNYDKNLDDVFEVQSDVAKQVAEALRVRILSPEKERIERKPTESTTAYTLYLKGRQLWNKREIEDVREALVHFERAVKEDPGFALGYVGQADCHLVDPSRSGIERIAKAKAIVAKALELDPDLAEAHATNGMVLRNEYDLRHAEDELKRAIELKPSYTTAHQWYSMLLREELRWDEALKEVEKAVELDPLSGLMVYNLGFYYYARRDFSKAIVLYKRAVELGFKAGHEGLANIYGKMKLYDDMKRESAAAVEVFQSTFPVYMLLVELGTAYFQDDRQTLRRLLLELEAQSDGPLGLNYLIAGFYFYLGKIDKGFEWLERSYSKREAGLLEMAWDWDLDGIRNDPRYLDLLKRLGLD